MNLSFICITIPLEPYSGSSGNIEDASNEELIRVITYTFGVKFHNSLIPSFNGISHDLVAKRDAVVTELELLNNIQAIKAGTDSLVTRSISCSTK